MKKLVIKTGKNIAIVTDNASFYTAGDCEAFYLKQKLEIISIIPKVPMLNAIEQYFSLPKGWYKKNEISENSRE
jgi:hypothetical protein